MGDASQHWFIAYLACETGIAPSVLIEQSERMLFTMGMYLRWKATEMSKGQ